MLQPTRGEVSVTKPNASFMVKVDEQLAARDVDIGNDAGAAVLHEGVAIRGGQAAIVLPGDDPVADGELSSCYRHHGFCEAAVRLQHRSGSGIERSPHSV